MIDSLAIAAAATAVAAGGSALAALGWALWAERRDARRMDPGSRPRRP